VSSAPSGALTAVPIFDNRPKVLADRGKSLSDSRVELPLTMAGDMEYSYHLPVTAHRHGGYGLESLSTAKAAGEL
jgi:hypothetical protein